VQIENCPQMDSQKQQQSTENKENGGNNSTNNAQKQAYTYKIFLFFILKLI
jgi:hypothetical protein